MGRSYEKHFGLRNSEFGFAAQGREIDFGFRIADFGFASQGWGDRREWFIEAPP